METETQFNRTRAQCIGRHALPVKVEAIPPSIRALKQWLVWGDGKPANADGKLDKKPRSATKHTVVDPTSPSNWSDFSTATSAYSTGKYCGIGIGLGGQPVGTNAEGRPVYLHAIDVDNIFQIHTDSTSQVDDRLEKLVQILGPVYMEFSPSGVGVRIFLHSTKVPETGRNENGFEWYTQQRYLTVTGQRISTATDLTEVHEQAIDQFVRTLLTLTPNASKSGVVTETSATPKTLDLGPVPTYLLGQRDEVLQRLLRGPFFTENHDNIARLSSALSYLDPDADDNFFFRVRKGLKDLELQHDWTSAKDVARKWARGDFWKQPSVKYYQDDRHHQLSLGEADRLFDKRWNQLKPEANGNDIPFRMVLHWAEEAGWNEPSATQSGTMQMGRLNLDRGRIDVSEALPPPQKYILGTFAAEKKTTILAGLGGVSKTTLSCQLATAVAIGESFGNMIVAEGAALLILGEDDADDINRRFKAILRDRNRAERDKVRDRLRAFPMAGIEMKLTQKSHSGVSPTSFVTEVIECAKRLEQESGCPTKLIVLDNIRLAMAGDTNNSDEAASVMNGVTDIASQTGAAVVVLGHSPKTLLAKLKAGDEPDAGDIVGSTAFVNSARAASLLSSMTDKEAKLFGIDIQDAKNYVKLSVVKSNIGPTDVTFWYRRVPIPGYDTSLLEPVTLGQQTSTKRNPVGTKAVVKQAIVDLIRDNREMTANKLRGYAKKTGRLKASQANVWLALDELRQEGVIKEVIVDETNRASHTARLGTTVLVVADGDATSSNEKKR